MSPTLSLQPVRCSKLEELREISRAVRPSQSEMFSVQKLQIDDHNTTVPLPSPSSSPTLACADNISNSSARQCSKLDDPQVSRAVTLTRCETFVIQDPPMEENRTISPSSSSPSDSSIPSSSSPPNASNAHSSSSSSSSCAVSVSNSSAGLCIGGEGLGERQGRREGLDDSGSSCQSQASTSSSIASRSSQGSLGGCGSRGRGTDSGTRIARAGSRSGKREDRG